MRDLCPNRPTNRLAPALPVRVPICPTHHTTPALRRANPVRHLILSDLHLCSGQTYADTTTGATVARYLRRLAQDEEPLELVFAGDTFEFLQVRPNAADHQHWSEPNSLTRLAAIVHAHPDFVEMLQQFLHHPQHRLTFLIGNHDFELHYHGVQARLRGLCGGRPDQVQFGTSYRGLGLVILHGNQSEPYNQFLHFSGITTPFEEVYGTRLVRHLFTPIQAADLPEAKLFDHTCPYSLLLWYLLQPAQLRRAAVRRFLLRAAVLMWYMRLQAVPRYTLAAAPAAPDPLTLPAPLTDAAWHTSFEVLLQREIERLARVPALQDVRLFVAGHTHTAIEVALGHGKRYLNTGTWKATLAQIEPPRRIDRQNAYVEVTYPDGLHPQGVLRVWEG